MRLLLPSLLLASTSTLVSSTSTNDNELNEPSNQAAQTSYERIPNLKPHLPVNTGTSISATTSSAQPIPTPSNPPVLHQFELRQAVGAAGGSVAPTVITQMSPVTTYQIHGPDGSYLYIPYTQTFPPTPDQWPSPTPGTIGLGTIQGQIGIVKTSKRSAQPTGVVERFIGGGSVRQNVNEVGKRETSAAAVKSVPVLAGTALVWLGCLMALL